MMKNAIAVCAIILSGLAFGPSAGAETIGVTGAVNPNAQGTPPGGTARTLKVGGNVVHRETIDTSGTGAVQLVFVDRTTLNIGPNSHVVIDEFVFDPTANTGRMAATLTRGALRFVGGQTSHTGGATIRTPATTLGVRGGVASVRHDPVAGTRVINHFGRVSVETATGTEMLRRPGFALSVGGATPVITTASRVGHAEMAQQSEALAPVTRKSSSRRGRGVGPNGEDADAPPPMAAGAQSQTASNAAGRNAPPPMMAPGSAQQQAQAAVAGGAAARQSARLAERVRPSAPIAPIVPPSDALRDPNIRHPR